MKTIILFFTLIVLVSSGTSIITKKLNSEDGSFTFNPAASPLIDVQLIDQFSEDMHLRHSRKQGIMGFCYDCGMACLRKNRKVGKCKNFKCQCTISEVQ